MGNGELGRFALLVAALGAAIVLMAVDAEIGMNGLLVRIGVTGVLAAGVYVSSNRRIFLVVAVIFAAPALAGNWLGEYYENTGIEVLRHAGSTVFLAYVIGLVLMAVAREQTVSLDTVLGGVAAYLLIGVMYISVYDLLLVLVPGSLEYQGQALEQVIGDPGAIHGQSVLLYYSFVTLTTLGYGDVTPVRPLAQMLSTGEAIIGQLFVAIFIARLVAVYTRAGRPAPP